MNALIVSRDEDGYAVDAVAEAIEARGGRVWRLDTRRFPQREGLTWSGPGQGALALAGQGTLPLEDIDAVWLRRAGLPELPLTLAPSVRRGAALEALHVLMGSLQDTRAFVLDPPAVYERLRNKPLQLRLARAAGVEVPRTWEGNDPDAARDFAASCPDGVISKMYNDLRVGGGTIFTNVLGPEDIAGLDDIVACPTILQERVPKALELRVVVVGEQVFAMALDSQGLPGAEVDWRRTGARDLDHWRPYALPEELTRRLLALHDALGNNYSSSDMVLRPDGRFVLLDLNGVGESFWFYPHLPLAEAMADLLLGRVARRPVPGLR